MRLAAPASKVELLHRCPPLGLPALALLLLQVAAAGHAGILDSKPHVNGPMPCIGYQQQAGAQPALGVAPPPLPAPPTGAAAPAAAAPAQPAGQPPRPQPPCSWHKGVLGMGCCRWVAHHRLGQPRHSQGMWGVRCGETGKAGAITGLPTAGWGQLWGSGGCARAASHASSPHTCAPSPPPAAAALLPPPAAAAQPSCTHPGRVTSNYRC